MSETQVDIAKHLDMSERNLRDVLRTLDVDHRKSSLCEIRNAYIRHLREQAAGRGGSQQEQLAIARTEEATVKAALGRLDYLEKTKELVLVDDCVDVLQRWAGFAAVQYKSAMDKLITELQAEHKIDVDPEKVVEIANPTADRVADYARQLGASLSADRGDI